jgi:photosystem II stability/assembly factor-like uncharacterized protein
MPHPSRLLRRLLAAGLGVALILPPLALAAPPAHPFRHLKLRDLGPAIAGGRVTTVVGVPGQPEVYYVGAAGGGVWKTTNGGYSWKAILPHADTASIGAIALAPSDPSLVWVGTGEDNPRDDVLDGGGVYFSPDGGKTWKFRGLRHAGQISAMVVDPTNPKIVFACVLGNLWKGSPERGVYRSTNEGKTWTRVLATNDHAGCSTLAYEPGNPEVMIAGLWYVHRFPWKLVSGGPGGGLYRSTDGGKTWTKLTRGLPKMIGRSAVAFAPSRPDWVYAVLQAKHGTLWVSHDLGKRWKMVSNDHAIDVRPFYFTQLAVTPNDPERLFLLSMDLMETKNGGKSFFYADPMIHVDHHAIWIDPRNPERIIQGNDGGVAISHDEGKTWRYLDNLPIEEFYQVAVADKTTPFLICGGIQDNNAICGPSSEYNRQGVTGQSWFVPVGGDGEYAVPAPSDPNIIYADSENGYIVRYHMKHGAAYAPFIQPYLHSEVGHKVWQLKYRFNWTAPIAVSYTDPEEVYLGANVVFKSTDGGRHWTVISPNLTRSSRAREGLTGGPIDYDISGAENYDTIESISIARTNPNVLWVGTDDGWVWVTRDGGKHWTNVTPSGALPWARVYQIGVSPFHAGTAYVAFDGHELGNNRPYVYRTTDYGRSWRAIDRGLPHDASTLVVREDPDHPGFLAAGTMIGVYYSRNDGRSWHRLGANLPTMSVWDLKFVGHPDSLVLATHGRGLWVLDDLRPLVDFNRTIAREPFHLFPAAPGTLFYTNDIGDPAAPFYKAPNAPIGVILSYYLAHGSKPTASEKKAGRTPVRIQILNGRGHVIDTFYGPSHAGVNLAVWNLSYQGPRKMTFGHYWASHGPQGFPGPSVAPGRYVARVSVAGHSATETVVVRPDPRLGLPLARYVAQRNAALELRNEVTAMDEMLDRLHRMRATIRALEADARANPALARRFATVLRAGKPLAARMTKLIDAVYNPARQHNVSEDSLRHLIRLHQQIINAYDLVAFNYAQRINGPVRRLMAERRAELHRALARYNLLVATAVARYNKLALAAGAPSLMAGPPVHVAPIVTDL